MKKLTLLAATILSMVALLVFPTVSFAASCGKDKDGKPIATSIDYGCKGVGDGITQIALVAVNFLAIGVGIAVVGGIVWGAIRYTTANGNAAQAQQGVSVIINAIIGLVLFIFMFAIINFLVPGGFLN